MIYGLARLWKRDSNLFLPAFDKAFAFLEGKDLLNMEPGRYDIDGDRVFALLQDVDTKAEADCRYEAHAKYIDIQLIVSGREKQLYSADDAGVSVTEDALAERDVIFYTRPEQNNSVILEAGSYAVYQAGELHCPCCSSGVPGEKVRKVVFKVAAAAID